jgi:hypothetical protein
MKEIQLKINELLEISKQDTSRNGFRGLFMKMNKQDKIMSELKTLARKENTPLGRIIKFQMADSYAYYVVSHLTKQKVVVTWIDYCDGWIDDRLGKTGVLEYNYVLSTIQHEDYCDALYEKKINSIVI